MFSSQTKKKTKYCQVFRCVQVNLQIIIQKLLEHTQTHTHTNKPKF